MSQPGPSPEATLVRMRRALRRLARELHHLGQQRAVVGDARQRLDGVE